MDMHRVIIVDDEIGIRDGLKFKIDWESIGFRIVGEAANGEEALSMMNDTDIDVVITDIRMPIMNGIDLLKRCAERYPHVKIIVLSGYDDFAYLKVAIQCGAKDYLLKPVVRSELIDILKKLGNEVDVERLKQSERNAFRWQLERNLPVLQEHLILHLIHEDWNFSRIQEKIGQLEMETIFGDDQPFRFVCVEMRIPIGRLGELNTRPDLLTLAFQMICRELVQQPELRTQAFAFHDWIHPHMMFFIVKPEYSGKPGHSIKRFIDKINTDIRHYLKVETVIGVGQPVTELAKLRDGYVSCLLSWSRSRPGAVSQTVYAETSELPDKEFAPELEKRLLIALENADAETFNSLLLQVISTAKDYSMNNLAQYVMRVSLLLDFVAKKNGIGIKDEFLWTHPELLWKLDTEKKAFGFLTAAAADVVALLKNARATSGSAIVGAVRKYIDDSYAQELSLTMLAERFHINAAYLSDLFKKHIGESFSEYWVHIRLSHAQNLLNDPKLRLSDIAELVGFSNASYFSSVFKKHFGISPNDYRAKTTS
jgi:two-component system response regulator YesN